MRAFLLLLVAATAAPGSPWPLHLRVSPTLVDLRMAPGERAVHTLRLFNSGEAPFEIGVRVSDWTMTPDGAVSFGPAGSTPGTCAGMIEVIPERLRVAAGGQAEVVMVVAAPGEPRALRGTRWAAVLFELPEVRAPEGDPTRVRLGAAVYVTGRDTPVPVPTLQVTTTPLSAMAIVTNPGEAVVRYRIAWRLGGPGAASVAAEAWNDQVVLPGARREYPLASGALDAGEYAVQVRLTPEGSREQLATADVVVP
jgi:P pilus assembly chaperone PapD